MNRLACLALVLGASLAPAARAQAPDVHFVWMGGDDCPPCVLWRRQELPKLQASREFQAIRFSYVSKTVRSSVPPVPLLPAEVRPYKDKLDWASAGRAGSPQGAILVNGEVYDYFHGAPLAVDIERMLAAVRTGAPYPFKRCLRASKIWNQCEVPA